MLLETQLLQEGVLNRLAGWVDQEEQEVLAAHTLEVGVAHCLLPPLALGQPVGRLVRAEPPTGLLGVGDAA